MPRLSIIQSHPDPGGNRFCHHCRRLCRLMVFRAHGARGFEGSVLKFAGMKPVRETLLGMVDAASDAKRRKWLDQNERLWRAPGVRSAHSSMSVRDVQPPGRFYARGNGIGHLEMVARLRFRDFQHAA